MITVPVSTTPGVAEFDMAFDESLDAVTNVNSPLWTNSVMNPQNWDLYLNGSQVLNAVESITFSRNSGSSDAVLTRKYVATVRS